MGGRNAKPPWDKPNPKKKSSTRFHNEFKHLVEHGIKGSRLLSNLKQNPRMMS